MSLRPTSEASLNQLRQLRIRAAENGDEALAVILAGVELYLSLGREFDLIEQMKHFADSMKDTVEQTPTAADLRRLYLEE